jgi:hypothetical protein
MGSYMGPWHVACVTGWESHWHEAKLSDCRLRPALYQDTCITCMPGMACMPVPVVTERICNTSTEASWHCCGAASTCLCGSVGVSVYWANMSAHAGKPIMVCSNEISLSASAESVEITCDGLLLSSYGPLFPDWNSATHLLLNMYARRLMCITNAVVEMCPLRALLCGCDVPPRSSPSVLSPRCWGTGWLDNGRLHFIK